MPLLMGLKVYYIRSDLMVGSCSSSMLIDMMSLNVGNKYFESIKLACEARGQEWLYE